MEDKKYALTCWSNNEHYNADFDRGVVLVDDELRRVLADRKRAFDEILGLHPELLYMEFHGSPVEYVSDLELSEYADSLGDETPEWAQKLQDGDESAEIPLAFTFTDENGDFHSECDHTIIQRDGVRWSCIPKHSSITIETATLSWEELGMLPLVLPVPVAFPGTTLTGRRFVNLKEDSEDDSEFGEVTHPVGSEFTVGKRSGENFEILWHYAVDGKGNQVPADGMWTLWTPEEILRDAREIPPPMRIEQLIAKLEECACEGPEEGHIQADALLLEYINDQRVTAAFKALSKWYA